MSGRKRVLWPPLALMLFSFVLSSIPGTPQDGKNFLGFVPPGVQNLLHIPLFALLAWFWLRSFRQLGQSWRRAIVLAVLLSVSWGVLDEVHQYYVPGRFASLTDIALNIFGILIGIAVACFALKTDR